MKAIIKRVSLIAHLVLLIACSEGALKVQGGDDTSLKDFSGQWLLINYWAIWCKPCIEEIPELNALNLQEGISVLGYNFDRAQGAELEEQIASLAIDFPVLLDDPAASLGLEAPKALPATIVLDQQGQFHSWLMGPQTRASITAHIQKIR